MMLASLANYSVVDRKHQIIVEAQVHGTGSEQEALLPVVTAITLSSSSSNASPMDSKTSRALLIFAKFSSCWRASLSSRAFSAART